MRYNINDEVIIVKSGNKHEGESGYIYDILEMTHCPVIIYSVRFEDGSKGDYFFSDIQIKN